MGADRFERSTEARRAAMPLWNQITQLVKDPPPEYVFEISEAGLAFARNGQSGFQPFGPGALVVSPVEDNVRRPDSIVSAIELAAPPNGSKKRRRAAVILPDYAARVTVLDFDSFPSTPEEQLSLVRFRVKKTVPFDIESASVSYHVQPAGHGGSDKKVEVIAVTMALEIIARYEALFRGAGFQPGDVTTSGLAALNLCPDSPREGVIVAAKLAGHVISVMVIAAGKLKLFRCVTLEQGSEDEILAVLYPTFAYVEDELGSTVQKMILCGFPEGAPAGFRCETEPLRSRLGAVGAGNAGLLGYLEGAGN